MIEAPPSHSQSKSVAKGLAALALLVVALAALGWAVVYGLEQLQAGVAAAVVIASATVLTSVLSLIYSNRREAERAIEQANREKKLPVYEEFIAFWFRASFGSELGDAPSELDFKVFVRDFSQKLIFWASDDMILAYKEFRAAGEAYDEDSPVDPTLLLAFEKLLFEIRRDFGYKNKGLRVGDLLRFFITDVDEFLPATTDPR